MALALLWLLVVALGMAIGAAWLAHHPAFVARPILAGLLIGMGTFLALSSCVPIFTFAIPLAWNWLGVLVWEVVVAAGMGTTMGWALAVALTRRRQDMLGAPLAFMRGPISNGVGVGLAFFAMSTLCASVTTIWSPLDWNWVGILAWEGIALSTSTAIGWAVAVVLLRRSRST